MFDRKWPSRAAAIAGVLAVSVAGAARAADPQGAQINAQYRVYAHGLHIADATASYRLTDWGYGINTHLTAGGLLSVIVRMDVKSHAEGRLANGLAAPVDFGSEGYSRGRNRAVSIVYRGDQPVVTQVTPVENDREAIPDADKAHAIDTLSAMALLLSTIERTGHCDGSARIFDGLRLTNMQVHGPVTAEVPEGASEVFTGSALRCDFTGQQIAGFIKDSSHLDVMKAPRPGAAWFQPMAGLGLVAVRIEFDHPKIGHMVAVLDRVPQKT